MNPCPQVGAIAIADHDPATRKQLGQHLAREGFEVIEFVDGHALERSLGVRAFDLLILDTQLPGKDGLSICRHLRETGHSMPIVMISARVSGADRILGFYTGADDYVCKPLNVREIGARVRAILRRCPVRERPIGRVGEQGVIVFGPFEFQVHARRLRRHGRDLPLTSTHFEILRVLVEHPRQLISRDRLARLACHGQPDDFVRGLDVQMSRLRRLLSIEGAQGHYIQTVRGMGYLFEPSGTEGAMRIVVRLWDES